MAPFGAYGNGKEPLLCPYCARDLCPADLCLDANLLQIEDRPRVGNSLLQHTESPVAGDTFEVTTRSLRASG